MHIWTVANQKGGVGKTTTTVAIAGYLASQGYRTLMLDLDPQGSLTTYVQQNPDNVVGTAYDIFDRQDRVHTRGADFPNLELIGGSIGLAQLEKKSDSIKGKGLVVDSFVRTLEGKFDYVLIDTPPALGLLMVGALVASEQLVVPVQTDFLALKGLERMIKVLTMLGSSSLAINDKILPTMFDKRTNASKRTLISLKNQYGERVSPIRAPTDTKFRDASRMGVPPGVLFPRCQGVEAYQRFVRFLLESRAAEKQSQGGACRVEATLAAHE